MTEFKSSALTTTFFISINILLIIQQAIFYYSNQAILFQILAAFLCIERFIIIIFITANLYKMRSILKYFLLNLLFLGWEGVGYSFRQGIQVYDESLFKLNIKKCIQFLNSIPNFLAFYYISSYKPYTEIPTLFVISIIYNSFLTSLLITQRQYDRKTESITTNCLYFLSHFGGIISYWGLLGQICYNGNRAILLLLTFTTILWVVQLNLKKQPQTWFYFLIKQLFLIKLVDSFSFSKLQSKNPNYHMQSLFQSFQYIIMIIYKLINFRYQNDFDILLYYGIILRSIEFIKIVQNLFYIKQYGPKKLTLSIKLNEKTLEQTRNTLEQKNLIKYLNINIIVEDITKESINDQLLQKLIYLIKDKEYQYLINLVTDENVLLCIISHQKKCKTISVYGISNKNDFEFIFRFIQMYQTQQKLSLNLINQSIDEVVTKDFQIARYALEYLKQPISVVLKRNYFTLELVQVYNNQLKAFIISTITLTKQSLYLVNINPNQIIYDLYESY
ncbi:hypothetical protein ABPG74_001205 [Tetrahymena malaccensis]